MRGVLEVDFIFLTQLVDNAGLFACISGYYAGDTLTLGDVLGWNGRILRYSSNGGGGHSRAELPFIGHDELILMK